MPKRILSALDDEIIASVFLSTIVELKRTGLSSKGTCLSCIGHEKGQANKWTANYATYIASST